MSSCWRSRKRAPAPGFLMYMTSSIMAAHGERVEKWTWVGRGLGLS